MNVAPSTVPITPELREALEESWSRPVQIKVEQGELVFRDFPADFADKLDAEGERESDLADSHRGQEVENVALESYHRGRAVGLFYAARLLREGWARLP